MAFDREAARQAGYSEDEINAYLQAEAEKQKVTEAAPVVADVGEPPAPTTVINPVESSAASVATTAGLGAAPYVIPAVGTAAAAYGGGKVYSAWKSGADAAQALAKSQAEQAAARMASEQGIMERASARAAGRVPVAPSAPTTPAGYGNMRYNVPTGGAPSAPVMPQGAPATPGPVAPVAQGAQMAEQAAARAPSLLDKTTSMIRQLAASKVLDTLGKGMTGLQLATYSPELGPQVPQTGRMRGMEINPMTGRPWTKEQLAQYNANPSMFDSQLPPAQMPR